MDSRMIKLSYPQPRTRLVWLGCLLWCLSLMAAAAEIPAFSAEYALKRNGVTLGTATRSLRPLKDNRYLYASVTYASGMIAWFVKDRIDESSTFVMQGDRIRPLEYIYNRHGGAKGRRVKLAFDWERGVVTNVIDGDPWRMEIPPDVHDKLGYQLAIMQDLQRGRKELQYSIADGGKLKTYAFQILGEEQVESPFGRLKTVKLRRTEDKRDTTVWCAPALHYLPVRLEQRETDGSQLSMHLISVTGLEPRTNAEAAAPSAQR